jgi:hypothetical protein
MEDMRNEYRIFVCKPEGEKPVGRPRRRWEDNIKMDLIGIVCQVWIVIIQLREQFKGWLLINLQVP